MKIDITEYSKKDIKKKVTNASKNNSINFFGSFSDKKKEKLYKELKILLHSGVNLKKAIDIILEETKSNYDKSIITTIQNEILKGKSFSNAMEKTGVFSTYEIFSVEIGEETKNLEHIFNELQLFFYRKIQIKRQIITVSTYPAFVIGITILVLIFMLRSVVPMFAKVFKQFGGELPSLTKKIIYISDHSSYIFGTISVLILTLIAIHFYFKKNLNYRSFISNIMLKIPFFGKIINTIYLARFSQSMSLLLSAKKPLIDSLDLVKKMINYYPIEASIPQMTKDIIKGKSLGNSMSKYKVYDTNLVSMIKVAEEVNQLDKMFDTLSTQYSEDVEYKTKAIGVIMEPLIITMIGLIVGVIMIAMYLPMFDLSKILNRG